MGIGNAAWIGEVKQRETRAHNHIGERDAGEQHPPRCYQDGVVQIVPQPWPMLPPGGGTPPAGMVPLPRLAGTRGRRFWQLRKLRAKFLPFRWGEPYPAFPILNPWRRMLPPRHNPDLKRDRDRVHPRKPCYRRYFTDVHAA